MTLLEALLQGILQGLTEFLPVSSSGHLSLFQHFFGIDGETGAVFTVMLHIGTLIAVFIAYWKTVWGMILEAFRMIGDIFTGKFSYKKANEERKLVLMVLLSLVPLFAFLLIEGYISRLSEDNDILVEGVCFLFTGCLLFIADKCVKGKKTAADMLPRDALRVGVFQGIATMPGISRSGATISTGLLSGFSREFSVKFSFIMGIPTILGASLLKAKDAFGGSVDIEIVPLAVGIITSAIVGIFAIKLIQWLVKTNKFNIFAYYTLILGILVLIIGAVEMFTGESIVALITKT